MVTWKTMTIARMISLLISLNACQSARTITLSAYDIVERHIQARGGREKIAAIQSIRATGEMHRFGMVYDLVVLQKRPNYALVNYSGENEHLMRIPEKFDIQIISDGQDTWQLVDTFDGKGAVVRPIFFPWVRIPVQRDTDISGPLFNYADAGHRIDHAGLEEIEGSLCYRLSVGYKSGETEEWLIDGSTYDLRKRIIPFVNQMSGAKSSVSIYYYDYRVVDGIRFSHAMLIDSGPSTIERIFHEIEVNVELSDELFRKPAG
jgi:hypothetical protein